MDIYKAVHKIDGKFFSHSDKNWEYKIGEEYEEKIERKPRRVNRGRRNF